MKLKQKDFINVQILLFSANRNCLGENVSKFYYLNILSKQFYFDVIILPG